MWYSLIVVGSPSHVPTANWFLLPICTWIIYTMDRLWDVKNTQSPLTERHSFHKRHFTLLSLLVIAALLLSIIITFLYLSIKSISLGIFFTFFCGIHLATIQRIKKYPKELIASILYTVGVWFSAISYGRWDLYAYGIFFIFFICVLQNLLTYSIFDFENDKKSDTNSLCKKIGVTRVKKQVFILTTLNLFMEFLFWIISLLNSNKYDAHHLLIPLLIITITPPLLLKEQRYFIKNERYRWIGDGVFLLFAFSIFIV